MSNKMQKILFILVFLFLFLTILLVIRPEILTILAWIYVGISMSGGIDSFTPPSELTTDRGTYYRLTVQYLVDDVESLDFDIVVACGRFRVKTNGSEKGLIPAVYAKRTHKNHAVLIRTPDFCGHVEGRNLGQIVGVYDGSFTPFTVWFEDADDLQSGLGYSSIYAFDNPAARLNFLGATIRYASREDFEDWYRNQNENLINREALRDSPYTQSGWLKDDRSILAERCYGIGFVHAEENVQGILQKYWPENHPDFWSKVQLNTEVWLNLFKELNGSDEEAKFGSFNLPATSLIRGKYNLDWNRADISRSGASLNHSKLSDYLKFEYLPTEQYPVYFNDAIPALRRGGGKPYIAANIDLRPEAKGFVACYTRYAWRSKSSKEQSALTHYFGGARQYNDFHLNVNGQTHIRTRDFHDLGYYVFIKDQSLGQLIEYPGFRYAGFVE